MTRRRIRAGLTEEDVRLWKHVTAHIDPLRSRPPPPEPKPEPVPEPPITAPEPPKPQPRKKPKAPPVARPVAAPPAKPTRPPLAGIETRVRQRVSRGQLPIEARLDLHGMRQASAHRQLFAFLQDAQHRGLKVVLIVTGKGKAGSGTDEGSSAQERGVLRRLTPLWLGAPEARSFVLGFEEAAIQHGGSGALYVRIRRTRRQE